MTSDGPAWLAALISGGYSAQIGWQRAFYRDRDRKVCAVVMRADGDPFAPTWQSIAIEAEGPGEGGSVTLEGVFASHAHHIVCEDVLLGEAIARSEAYAREWQTGKDAAQCECEEIACGCGHPDDAHTPWSWRGDTRPNMRKRCLEAGCLCGIDPAQKQKCATCGHEKRKHGAIDQCQVYGCMCERFTPGQELVLPFVEAST